MELIATYATKIEPGVNWQEHTTQDMRIPARVSLDDLDTSNPIVAHTVEKIREWWRMKRSGMEEISFVMTGPYGVGKTHIALSALWAMRLEPEDLPGIAVPQGRFYLANNLLLKLSPSRDESTGLMESPRPSALVGTAPIIVVDDVGGQQNLPFIGGKKEDQLREIQARYFLFFDCCLRQKTSLIITTNLSISGFDNSDFAKHIGGRAFDRLAEMAPKGFMVGMEGVPSWRVQKGGR